jgi:hypothetical protein
MKFQVVGSTSFYRGGVVHFGKKNKEGLVFSKLLRNFLGTSWELLWNFFGTSSELLRNFFGTSLELLWYFFGTSGKL